MKFVRRFRFRSAISFPLDPLSKFAQRGESENDVNRLEAMLVDWITHGLTSVEKLNVLLPQVVQYRPNRFPSNNQTDLWRR